MSVGSIGGGRGGGAADGPWSAASVTRPAGAINSRDRFPEARGVRTATRTERDAVRRERAGLDSVLAWPRKLAVVQCGAAPLVRRLCPSLIIYPKSGLGTGRGRVGICEDVRRGEQVVVGGLRLHGRAGKRNGCIVTDLMQCSYLKARGGWPSPVVLPAISQADATS